jgi:hypothetical protein
VHQGRFQDYADDYAGMIDVIVTDPPYPKKYFPTYEALAQFALTTLVPGGWLVCLTGFHMDIDVRLSWQQVGLEEVHVGCYGMPSGSNKNQRKTSTGWHVWRERHKALLVYEKRGTPGHRRRGGAVNGVTSVVDMDQDEHEWRQSFAAFQELVAIYTNAGDVVCDPMLGWGTTLAAAFSLERRRCIGIEERPERYAYARQRLGLGAAA